MVNGKQKGKKGELEVANIFKKYGYETARRSAQFCGNNEEGAADVVNLPYLHVEVKRTEKFNDEKALQQAEKDAIIQKKSEVPIVVYRRNREDWKVAMRLETFMDFYKCFKEVKDNNQLSQRSN